MGIPSCSGLVLGIDASAVVVGDCAVVSGVVVVVAVGVVALLPDAAVGRSVSGG